MAHNMRSPTHLDQCAQAGKTDSQSNPSSQSGSNIDPAIPARRIRRWEECVDTSERRTGNPKGSGRGGQESSQSSPGPVRPDPDSNLYRNVPVTATRENS